MGSTLDAEGRTYLNARFGVLIGEHWEIALFGENLTEEDANQFIQAGPLFGSTGVRTMEPPRLFGLEVSYDL